MVYYGTALVRKGPLARVWLAAHWERKMSKTQYMQADIQNSIGVIIGGDQPPLALRFSGQLLLGVVKIYSRKARYLLEDCGDALVKLKMAFQTGLVDMPVEMTRASLQTITVGDAVTESDILLPIADFALEWDVSGMPYQGNHRMMMAQHRPDITLRQSYFASASIMETSTQDATEDPLQMGLNDDNGLNIGDLLNTIDPSLDIEMARDAQADLFNPQQLLGDNEFIDEQSKDMSLVQNMMDLGLSPDRSNRASAMNMGGRDPLLQETATAGDGEHPLDFDVLGDLPSIAELSAQTIGGNLFNTSLLPEMISEQQQQQQQQLPSSLRTSQQQQQQQQRQRRRRRRVLLDEVTELTRQEMMLDANALESTELSASQSIRSIEWESAQVDPIAYYLGAPTDLPPELITLFQQTHKRAVPEGIETPRLNKQQRVDASLMASTSLEGILGQTPASLMSHERSIARTGDDSLDISAMDNTMPVDEYDPMLAAPELSALPPMPLSPFMAEQDVPLHSIDPLSPQSMANMSRNQLFADIESSSSSSQLAAATAATASSSSRYTTRAAQLIRERLDTPDGSISFRQLTDGVKRSDAARLFFEVLVLNTKQTIRAEQSAPFDDILIHATANLTGDQITLES